MNISLERYSIHAANGDEVICHATTDGRYICPICGFQIKGKPPYDPQTHKPSFEWCPCCEYQFGWDDRIGPLALAGSLQAKWEELREQWLGAAANAEQVARQLSNLPIAPVIYHSN